MNVPPAPIRKRLEFIKVSRPLASAPLVNLSALYREKTDVLGDQQIQTIFDDLRNKRIPQNRGEECCLVSLIHTGKFGKDPNVLKTLAALLPKLTDQGAKDMLMQAIRYDNRFGLDPEVWISLASQVPHYTQTTDKRELVSAFCCKAFEDSDTAKNEVTKIIVEYLSTLSRFYLAKEMALETFAQDIHESFFGSHAHVLKAFALNLPFSPLATFQISMAKAFFGGKFGRDPDALKALVQYCLQFTNLEAKTEALCAMCNGKLGEIEMLIEHLTHYLESNLDNPEAQRLVAYAFHDKKFGDNSEVLERVSAYLLRSTDERAQDVFAVAISESPFKEGSSSDRAQFAKTIASRECSKNYGEPLAGYIQNFGLTDPSVLIEIATLAIEKDPERTSEYIQNFKIRDQHVLFNLFIKVAKSQAIPLSILISQVGNYCCDGLEKAIQTYPFLCFFQTQALDAPSIQKKVVDSLPDGLRDLSEKLCHEKNAHVKKELGYALGLVLLQSQLNGISTSRLEEGASLIQGLLDFRSPELRLNLIDWVVNTLQDDVSFSRFKELGTVSDTSRGLLVMLISPFCPDSERQRIGTIIAHREFKDEFRLQGVIRCLDVLMRDPRFSWEDKRLMVNTLLFAPSAMSPKNVAQNAGLLLQGLSFGTDTELKACGTMSKLRTMVEHSFIRCFDIEIHDDFGDLLLELQSKFRKPEALFIYAAAIERLDEEDAARCKPVFRDYVQGVMGNTFLTMRYDPANNEHLATIFKGNQRLETEWKKGAQYPLELFLHGEAASKRGRNKLKANEQLNARPSYEGWKIIDTDDPCHLLLLGTEVDKSCQRIGGDPKFNKCLLSYLMDGKNRAMAVINDKEEIVARVVIRLLWDRQANRPVLFQERYYRRANCPDEIEGALNKACVRRAETLGLTLTSIKETPDLYEGPLASLFSSAPYEYVDSIGSVDGSVTNGVWTVSKVYILYLNRQPLLNPV